ncbi:MAG TPA: 3-hydroxyacyl-[acyl-carrier-protein] dehydratase FabZ [Firmicutes bacterium]|nr:3-hydroxyacyl-[acyl-carrier-protein] dehydratase FabZ [Bacillota bacterium]HBR29602.1 3-hydroxyacyl-[acyl-carrier-protein] dehydratase FabZ [Bacillota bacterium]HBR35350.1 3-hydroxyacyl-[acyl-carrier-protein] dehydratase FabZ [Bacillota bacterium]
MDINLIKELLPHRYPFLLVDRVISMEPLKRIKALKNVTNNEEYFTGHFPERPVMPGVLIIESMAQAAGLTLLIEDEHRGKIPFFTGIDKARFRRPVIPGDQLYLDVEILRIKGNVCRAHGKATVDGEVAAEAQLMFVLGNNQKQGT